MSDKTDSASQCSWPVCAKAPLLTCSSCGICRYCGKECQALHWKRWHKLVCDRKGQIVFAVPNDRHLCRSLNTAKSTRPFLFARYFMPNFSSAELGIFCCSSDRCNHNYVYRHSHSKYSLIYINIYSSKECQFCTGRLGIN